MTVSHKRKYIKKINKTLKNKKRSKSRKTISNKNRKFKGGANFNPNVSNERLDLNNRLTNVISSKATEFGIIISPIYIKKMVDGANLNINRSEDAINNEKHPLNCLLSLSLTRDQIISLCGLYYRFIDINKDLYENV